MEDGKYVQGSYFFYAPDKGAPVFFAVAFAASGLFHLYQCYRYKCFLLTALFPFCCLLFTAGFAVREYGAFHYDNLPVFIASICLIYAAPPLLELENYHILGRILYYVPYHSPLHPGRVLSTFAFLSGIVEALNGWGASYSANQSLTESQMAVGHALMKTSLLLQLVVAAAFITLIVTFHRRCLKHNLKHHNLQQPLITLYISIALILVRTIYRVVEYFGIASLKFNVPNFDPMSISPIVRYEWFFMVFEGSLMLANVVMFNFRHPRMYLPKSNKIYLAVDGVTELQGPGWKDPRPFLQTVLDPFDLIGMAKGGTGRGGFQNFWETDATSAPATTTTTNGTASNSDKRATETV